MSKRFWLTASAFSLFVVTATIATPASAGSEGLSKDAQSASSLDELKATDADLLGAISTLDKEVASQQAAVDAAQQAVDAANQAIAANDKALAETQGRLSGLQLVAQERAVEEYMRPHDDAITHMLAADGFSEASRRGALLQEVENRNAGAVDELKAARFDLDRERKAATDARKIADERHANEQKKLDALNAARDEKGRLDKSLQDRIAAYAAEDDASAVPRGDASAGRASRGGSPPAPAADDSRVSAAGLQWPVPSHQINSPFGMRWGRMHTGLDIQGSVGTPIHAAKAGTITFAGWESGYGNYTCIAHGGGFQTCYGHQSRIEVSVGQQVAQGQEIGLVGNTGTSAGAHLHFETCISNGIECFYGTYKNPISYLP